MKASSFFSSQSLLPLLTAFSLSIGAAAAQTTAPTTSDDHSQMRHDRMERGQRMQHSPEEMAQRQSQRLSQELGLSADQTAKVQQIMLTRGQEMQAARSQASGAATTREQMREQMQANRTKYDAQFKEVLTVDQYTKFTAMEAQQMQRGGRGRGMADANDAGKVKMKNGKVKVKKADKASK